MRVKFYLVSLAVSLLYVGQVMGQEHRVTGQVISGENRTPLLGVNITVQNTDLGTLLISMDITSWTLLQLRMYWSSRILGIR